MYCKIHFAQGKTVLGVCDKELLGKEFEDGKLFFRVSERFYGDKIVNEKELLKLLEEADSINLFGNKCVEIASKKGLINETQVIFISGIKHAQIYKV